MAKYRKKTVIIEAYQWHEVADYEDGVVRDVDYFRHPNVSEDKACNHCGLTMFNHGYIDTLEGGHIVCPNDWIITGVHGEKYPCKPDIFIETYDKIIGEDNG